MSTQRNEMGFGPRTALVVVDMQNDFADPRGSLFVPGGDELVAVIAELAEQACAVGALVVHTQDWHPSHTPHFVDAGGPWPRHCVKGSWGAEIVAGLDVRGPVVRKGVGGEDGYSGFGQRDPRTGIEGTTGLDDLLREHGIRRVVIAGLAQDVCVRATALDARRLGYEVVLVERATRSVDAAAGRRALDELKSAGVEIR